MNSLIIEVNEDKYLIRFKILKSVVTRKHTTEIFTWKGDLRLAYLDR